MRARIAVLTLTTAFMALAPIAPFASAQMQARPVSFKDLAERLSPAVVNISTSQNIEANVELPEFPKGSPLERFNDFFGNGEGRIASSLGSGFVIDPDGYIATNNHVIEDADIIEVTFPSGDTYVAKLLGRDPTTDVALLKIETGAPLPFVEWADSDTAEVGEWVLAIGNPFGYAGTVTAGIVSARNRNIDHGRYDDFIQSDVAINKGNSGGPLFDMEGKVVGMNTAILSPTGGSVGISFTTPSNLVKSVADQLRDYGETRRGYMGVKVQKVTKDTAKSYKLSEPYGALLTAVTDDGPAEKAGLKRGDLITKLDGKRVKTSADLSLMVAQSQIEKAIPVTYIRKRKEYTKQVTIERLKEKKLTSADGDVEEAQSVALGIAVEEITDAIRRKHRIDPDAKGVRVTGIDNGSSAAGKLRINDVIEEVELEPVTDVDDFAEKVEILSEEGRPITLLINRGGNFVFYSIVGES